MLADLEHGGWLYDVQEDAAVVYAIYKHRDPCFRDVPFDQFSVRYSEATKAAAKRRERSAQEAAWLEHDRRLHPRQTHNGRGEPVFDMDEAKTYLRADIKAKLHKQMTPEELWESRPEVYKKFKLDIFRQRIYQEIRRNKYLNYLEKKRNAKRIKFAKANSAST